MRNRAKDYELPEKEMLPVHVGIIMDGNGRWAKKRLMPRALPADRPKHDFGIII